MNLRNLSIYTTTLLFSVLSQANDLALADFQGIYKLKRSLVGTCPKKIEAIVEHFGNEEAQESFGVYCSDTDDCTTKNSGPGGSGEIIVDHILMQLTAINMGPQKEWLKNPMSGGYIGYSLGEDTLGGNELRSTSSSYKLNGTLLLKSDFLLKLEGKKLFLKLDAENRIAGAESVKNIECLYQR